MGYSSPNVPTLLLDPHTDYAAVEGCYGEKSGGYRLLAFWMILMGLGYSHPVNGCNHLIQTPMIPLIEIKH